VPKRLKSNNQGLDAYEKNAKPLIEYYEKKGLVKKVDAENTLALTEDDIKKIIGL
jgi:adenylate kinase family enzyme